MTQSVQSNSSWPGTYVDALGSPLESCKRSSKRPLVLKRFEEQPQRTGFTKVAVKTKPRQPSSSVNLIRQLLEKVKTSIPQRISSIGINLIFAVCTTNASATDSDRVFFFVCCHWCRRRCRCCCCRSHPIPAPFHGSVRVSPAPPGWQFVVAVVADIGLSFR